MSTPYPFNNHITVRWCFWSATYDHDKWNRIFLVKEKWSKKLEIEIGLQIKNLHRWWLTRELIIYFFRSYYHHIHFLQSDWLFSLVFFHFYYLVYYTYIYVCCLVFFYHHNRIYLRLSFSHFSKFIIMVCVGV